MNFEYNNEEVHHFCTCGQHDIIKLPNLISKQRVKEITDNLEKQLSITAMELNEALNEKDKIREQTIKEIREWYYNKIHPAQSYLLDEFDAKFGVKDK